MDLIPSPECCIFIPVSGDTHMKAIFGHFGHMAIWPYDHFSAIWPYAHIAKMAENGHDMGVSWNSNENAEFWRRNHSWKFFKYFRIFVLLSVYNWFIGKGADTSQQPKQTNKQTEPWCKQFLYGIELNSCGAHILLGTVVLLYRCSYSGLCTLVCRQTCGWPTLGKPWEHPYFWPMRAQVG